MFVDDISSIEYDLESKNGHFGFSGFRRGVNLSPRGVTVIVYPPGGDRFLLDFFEIFRKTSFPDPKSYSDVRKHIPDTSRRSRRVQNTILISKTYFKRIFGKSDPASPHTDFR